MRHRKRIETKQQPSKVRQSNQLLPSFSPFPVRHPVYGSGNVGCTESEGITQSHSPREVMRSSRFSRPGVRVRSSFSFRPKSSAE